MSYTIRRIVSLAFVLALVSSCAAVSFVTDCCKAHFINESSYDVTISATEPGEKTKTFTLAPGKKKMVSYTSELSWYSNQGDRVREEESEEVWWDYNFGMHRKDIYLRFYDI
ncbi:MAG: hypothetical protein KJP17_09635 [Gammaproteobacteria bacterium]|nr:hypothetical protein [Gammaproteobacteria bacterium]